MIVYYNSDTFAITGISGKLDSNRKESYFETEDPLAEQIFLGKEKVLKYIVEPHLGTTKGVIKLKPSKDAALFRVSDKVYKIPKNQNSAEIVLKQNKENKIVYILLQENSKNWWSNDPIYKLRKLYIVATLHDPYKPLWIKTFSVDDFNNDVKFNYQGTDNLTFYTPKIFSSYSHEITSD